MEKDIRAVLLKNKIRPNIRGYKYCFCILKIVCKHNQKLKNVYETVAGIFGIKANSVEKSVSNAIAKAFLSHEMQQKYAKLCWETGKINNKKFIEILKNQVLSHTE